MARNPISNLGKYAHPKGGGSSKGSKKTYEGSPADIAEDKRGEKATGMGHVKYERSARDKREDAKGMKKGK